MKYFRPTAIPLVTVDPYLSIWSFQDKLYDDITRHWTGQRSSMTGILEIDDKCYRFMGKITADDYLVEPEIINQTSVEVFPTKTVYNFENEIAEIQLTFRTPILIDDLELLSRPVSYVSYKVNFKDAKKHTAKIYFDICAEACLNDLTQNIEIGETKNSIFCGKGNKDVLSQSGDFIKADWGNLYLVAPDAEFYAVQHKVNSYKRNEFEFAKNDWVPKNGSVFIGIAREYKNSDSFSDFYCIAYEDFYSIEMFGKKIKCYWTKFYDEFNEVIEKSLSEYDIVNKKCDEFDKKLIKMASKISDKYADLISITYRQVMAAHKLCEKDGKLLYFSKECGSNGCISTVDITYPSMPMFLLLNADLLEGMLNPIFEFVEKNNGWNYDFAPHDLGVYPLANGQMYDDMRVDTIDQNGQMPVEESGNMILCVASLCHKKNDYGYAKKHKEILKKWADYLITVGYDPDSQLCTDDFAGHLAHNANLSVKGILAIAAMGKILNNIGENGNEYIKIAKDYSKQWECAAKDADHYSLTFDKKDTWSIKYNLVWDRILKLGIFDRKIAEIEVNFYKTKINKYGIPLDSRDDYTKSDWQIWSTCLTDDSEYRNMIIDAMWNLVCDIDYRVPFSDWYYTSIPVIKGFQARSVQGGLFLPMLLEYSE